MHALLGFSKFRKRRQDKYQRKAARLAQMRAAKARRRQARVDAGLVVAEPRLERTTGLSWAVRDDLTGHVEWRPLKSARDTARRVNVILKYYRPGYPV